MKKNASQNPRSLSDTLDSIKRALGRRVVLLFFLLLAAVYGFVLFRIGELTNAQPSESSISTGVKASAVPHIDPNSVQQIQNLKDNSVSVQALFNQARDNPFQE